jgi:PAS domain S-box-containing protein
MDPALVELTRRLAAGDPTARAELAQHPGEMARALDEMVTVMERTTALLAESEQYVHAIAQQSLVGIYVAARDRLLYANEAMAAMLGYGVDEIVGRGNLLDVAHPEDRPTVTRNFERRFRGETFRGSFRMMRKDGSAVLVETDGRRVVLRGEPVVIGSVVAVGTHRRGLTQARRQRQALFRSEKMATLGELLGGLVGEMDNPLTVAMGQAHLIEQMAGAGPVAERAHKIAEEAERAGHIVRRFMAFVHDYPLERGLVSLNGVVRDVVDLFDHSLRRGRIDVALALSESLPAVWGDAHRLHELVAHLITNASQAMRGGPPPRRLTIATMVIPETTHVALEVSDTGPGVSVEARARLFEPFFTTKPAGVGTGLGLFVCLEIAKEHRGTISLLDSSGQGRPSTWTCPSEHPTSADRRLGVASWPERPGRRVA